MPAVYSSSLGVRVPPVMTNFIPCTSGAPSVQAPTGAHAGFTAGARSPHGRRTAAVFADIGKVTWPRVASVISLRKIASRSRRIAHLRSPHLRTTNIVHCAVRLLLLDSRPGRECSQFVVTDVQIQPARHQFGGCRRDCRESGCTRQHVGGDPREYASAPGRGRD